MPSDRPDADHLLARLRDEESRAGRGRLKVFFGFAAGVGKTYAMLEAARREKADGTEVVVGYVEPHGRAATEALLDGLEQLPFRTVPYQGITLREFDLDAALARRPKLLLVDELAHTNAVGSRHAKRWQDVEELIAAGIDVWSTLNVQHLESLNDVIARITGVVVRETLPDAVIEGADEIELVDITPDELRERLDAGLVYKPEQARVAAGGFFRKANLAALRELATREAADRLGQDVETERRGRSAVAPWATHDRLLTCVGPSPTSGRLIRTAKRLADALGAEWHAVAVESSEQGNPAAREQVARHLRLAEQLGGEAHLLVASDVAGAILDHARTHNVTKIVVGKTARPRWRQMLSKTVVDDLLERSGEIDVYVIRGGSEAATTTPPTAPPSSIPLRPYAYAAGVVAACSLVGWAFQTLGLAEANIVMVFLLGTTVVAAWLGRGPAIAATMAGVLLFDFLFVSPRLSFAVGDAEYLITFAVMLAIGLLVSAIMSRMRRLLVASRRQERRSDALYRLTQQMSEVVGAMFLVPAAGRQLREIFAGEVVLFLRETGGSVELRFGGDTSVAAVPVNAVVAQWVTDHDAPAGLGTDTLPNATALFVPLVGTRRTVGAIGVRPVAGDLFADPENRRLLDTCARLVALSIERDQSVLEAQQSSVRTETEKLRTALLSSVSHDLRTPLASIAGSAAAVLSGSAAGPERDEMLRSVVAEANRLSRLVANLLEMTRLEAGATVPNRQWNVLEEIVGSALGVLKDSLAGRTVTAVIPEGFPLLKVDGVLLQQALMNLVDNATRHTSSGIDLTARVIGTEAEIIVADRGPGLPADADRLFDRFVRGGAGSPDGRRGVGLGLTVCRAIVEVHGGRVTARNRDGGGAEFVVTLPIEEQPV